MRPFFQWVTGHRALVIGGAALISAVAAMGAANVEVDYSVEQFFLTWGDERVVFDQYREIFSREDAQVAFFLSTEGGVSPHAFDALEHVASLFETVGLESVTWIGDLRGLREARASGAAELSRAAASVARDPVFRSFLWNEDGTVHVVQSVLPEHLNTDQGRRATQARLEEGLEDMDLGARWALSGTPILRAQVPELLEVDQTRLLGGGIVLFFVILYGFFGHVGRVLVSLAAVVPAYVVTLAIMAAFGKPVTVITSFIPIVILVVGICDTTHLLVHWQRHRVRGSDRRTSVLETFTGLASSCFFTSLTTALGFASLATTGIGVVMDFGIFTAIAVVTTFLFSMTLLPALLALGGDRPLPVRRVSWQRRGTEVIVRWARVAAVRRSPWLIRAFAIVGLAALALAAQLRIDTYLVDDLKEDTTIIQDLRWIESSGFGLFQTNLFVRAGEADLTDPEMAVWLHDFQRFVEQEPLVAATFGLPDLVRAVYERPIRTLSRSDIAAALGVARMVAPAAVEGVYRPEEGAAQIVVTVRDRGSRVTLPFIERVDDYLGSHPPGRECRAHRYGAYGTHVFIPRPTELRAEHCPGPAADLVCVERSLSVRPLRPTRHDTECLSTARAVGGDGVGRRALEAVDDPCFLDRVRHRGGRLHPHDGSVHPLAGARIRTPPSHPWSPPGHRTRTRNEHLRGHGGLFAAPDLTLRASVPCRTPHRNNGRHGARGRSVPLSGSAGNGRWPENPLGGSGLLCALGLRPGLGFLRRSLGLRRTLGLRRCLGLRRGLHPLRGLVLGRGGLGLLCQASFYLAAACV